MTKKLVTAAIVAAAITFPAAAQENLVSFKTMTPELALKLAQKTLESCRTQGFQVAVSVVDRSGILQVALRDRFAGPHTPETSRRKAWTAVSFRTDTLEMSKIAKVDSGFFGLNFVQGASLIGGGIRVEAGGVSVGGVGVSGAPSGEADHQCAQAGIAAVDDDLNF